MSSGTHAKHRHMQAERSHRHLLFVKSPPWIMKLGMTPACSSKGWAVWTLKPWPFERVTLLLTVEDAALVAKAKLPSGQLLEVVAGLPGQQGSIRS